jgi:splicing factor 3A subunit 3
MPLAAAALPSRSVQLREAPAEQIPLEFTGEEMYGRYLDLHTHYQTFINLTRRKAPPTSTPANGDADGDGDAEAAASSSGGDGGLDYMTYVQQFSHFHRTPAAVKLGAGYREYVEELLRYLVSFHERTLPLKPVGKLLGGVEAGFAARWDAGEVLGWEDRGEGSLPAGTDLVLEPEVYGSAKELLDIGARPSAGAPVLSFPPLPVPELL